VETRLYEFQLTQSQDGVTCPFVPLVTPQPIQPLPGSCEVPWDEMMLRADQAITAICRQTEPPGAIENNPRVNRVMATTTTPLPSQEITAICMSTAPPRAIATNTRVNRVTATIAPLPSQAMTFMQGRPEGPQQCAEQATRSQERQLSTQLQAKGTTSIASQSALAAISTIAGVHNIENQPVVNVPRTKRKANASKTKNTRQKISDSQPTSRPLVAHVSIVRTQPSMSPMCTFGCCHSGLLDLIQMASKNTKYGLKEGNFFHGKQCADCNHPIAELFATSKNKALFYYCPVDYNLAELDDDSKETSGLKPCNCILCITCYFKRETKKQIAKGPAMRSSRRR
jgi:hypothetical protein